MLSYASAPLAEPFEIAGGISLQLQVSSSARDTDFVTNLLEIDAAGQAINVTHGITRMRWREGFDKPRFLDPGEIYPVSIDLWFANLRFAAGSRIGLHISSSHFPFFDGNLNTGEDNYTTAGMVRAINTIHHGADCLSWLLLPARKATPIRFLPCDVSGSGGRSTPTPMSPSTRD